MLRKIIFSILLVPFALTSGCKPADEPPAVSVEEARAIAKDAYVFGLPMLGTYQVIYAFNVDTANPQYKGPLNSILNIARVFSSGYHRSGDGEEPLLRVPADGPVHLQLRLRRQPHHRK